MAGQSIRFDFLSTGAASLARDFSNVGDTTAAAARGAAVLSDVIGRLGEKENRTAAESVLLAKALRQTGDAEDRVAARAVLADAAIRRLGDSMQDLSRKQPGGFLSRLFGGGAGGAGGLSGGAASGGTSAASGAAPLLSNPYVAAGAAAAAAAAAPFAAQLAGGGIVAAFGAALAGIAILGASKAKSVQESFANLQKNASASLVKIGSSFVPVLNGILSTANSVLGQLTPVFAAAAKTIAGPFKAFSDTLIKAFGQPAVQQSIAAVATAFGKILTAVSPALTAGIGKVADGITEIASNISKMNPAVITHFVNALFDVVAALLDTLAWLIKVGTYIEQHFGPAMHRVAVIFDGVRAEAHRIWNAFYDDTIGVVIRLNHNVETQFNSLRHGIAVVFDGARGDIAHAWDVIWNNTTGRVIRGIADVVGFIRGLPGKITAALGNTLTLLVAKGADVIQGFWNGLTSIWTKVTSWISGIASWIKAHKGPVSLDQQLLYPAGQALMGGFLSGLQAGFGPVGSFVGGIASWVLGKITGAGGKLLGGKVVLDTSQFSAGALGGAVGGNAAANRALARRMFPWPASMWGAFDYLEMREAGYNRFARNPSSGAYGIPQALPPTKMPFAAQAAGGSNAGAQLGWMFSYIRSVYGNPVNAAAHEKNFNWYAAGTSSALPGWAWVGERGPELVRFRGGEQVYPAGSGDGSGGLLAELRALRAEVRQLTGVAAAIPARTGQHVGGAINGAAGAASFRNRYPGGS